MTTPDFAAARRHMVDCQLRPNKIADDRLIAAMGTVAREAFLPSDLSNVAYIDEDIKLNSTRSLMEPMIFARLLQAAEIASQDIILDVGCGTGYSTAILANLGRAVVAIEEDKVLAMRAQSLLGQQVNGKITIIERRLADGYSERAPYDVILIEGAVPVVPKGLLSQLKEGGRLVTVIRENGMGKATLFLRRDDTVSSRVLFDAAIPMLPGFPTTSAGFVF